MSPSAIPAPALTIVIPAAGNGSRFREAGYDEPKPLIDVVGKPMLARVMDNLRPDRSHRFVVISRLNPALFRLPLGLFDLHVFLEHDTEGAVQTILETERAIAGPVLIGNCDQLVDFDVDAFLQYAQGYDGALVTFKSHRPHHSYVELHGDRLIKRIVEKEVISNQAVTGVYYFNDGDAFVRAAMEIVHEGQKVKGEYYVSLVIQRLIDWGMGITTYEAPSAMLGTPEELQLFEMAVKVGRTL